MRTRRFTLFFSALALAVRLSALSLGSGPDPLGNACDTVTWLDANGQSRTVWIKSSSPGAYITRYTYYAGATLVDARVRENYPPWGFLVLTNHWMPDTTGNFVTSCNASDLTVPLTRSIPFQGAHHLIWRGTFRMRMNPTATGPFADWYNDVDYLFQDGRNDFVFTCAYDSSDMPQASLRSDIRGPYGDFDFDGNGSANEAISGLGWGTKFKFRTTSAPLSASSSWDYSQTNNIPYVWQWKDAGAGDREFGLVQNQPYKDQGAGCEYHTGSMIAQPPSTGAGLPDGSNYFLGLPYQMNSYGSSAIYVGERFTWGSVYHNAWGLFNNGKGVFEEGHGEALGSLLYGTAQNGFMQYPVNAWSHNVLIDRYSDSGLTNLVADTDRAYGCTLTASVGSVIVSGPRGPGSYVAPATGSMPTVTYSRPGLDFVYRAWTLQASAGAVTASLAVPAGGLDRPTFIFKGVSAVPCLFQLDGVAQMNGTDYFGSLDVGQSLYYVTFNKAFAAGTRNLQFNSTCGTPTFTATVCGACSATSTVTPTRSATATATPTPVPACSALLVDDLEDGNTSNLVSGAWSSYAAAPASVSLPDASVAGAPASTHGTLHSILVTGTNSGSQIGSISTSFGSATDLSSKSSLSFWIKATSGSTSYRVNIARTAITDYDNYGAAFTAPAGVWTLINLPLNTMTQAGWGVAVPRAWNDVTGLTLYASGLGAFSIAVDDVSFDCAGPTPTPSSTRTPTPSRTASPTNTASPTPPPVGSTFTQTPSSLLTPCTGATLGSFLQNGDKILFLGDSITYRGNFTRMVQAHLSDRFPSAGFTFYNAGGPGDAGQQVLARIGAVLAQNPQVVLLCLGMNDAYNAGAYQTDFPYYMDQIVTTLQGAGIRVALLTPGIVDLSAPTAMAPDYNTRLRWEADWVLTYAASKGLPAFDVNAEMDAANTALKAALPGACMIPDSVHPDPAGGWIMGLGALKALGVPDRCGEIIFNAGSAYVEASGPLLANGATGSSFNLQLGTLPPVAPSGARKVLPYEPLQAQLNHLRLQASGLAAASYYIVIDGHRSGPVSAAALAAGINLYDFWMAPAVGPNDVHSVSFVDASGQPAYVCDSLASSDLIDNFETPPLGQWLVNRWAGDSWGLDPGSGTSTVSPLPAALGYSVPGNGGGSCIRISGTADANFPPVLISYLSALNSDVKQGIRFWAKGLAGKQARFQIHTWAQKRMATESWNDYGYLFTFNGSWQQVSIPYSSLALPSWGPTPFYPFVPQEIYNLDWLPTTAGAFDIAIDDIEFYCTSVSSPTPTRTPSASATASATRTPSPSPSSTATITLTATASPSVTPSISETPYAGTPTNTGTPSASPTQSETFTVSPSSTASASATVTAVASATSSATATPSRTVVASSTSSATVVVGSFTPTVSATRTPTTTMTVTSTSTTTPLVVLGTATFSSTPTTGGGAPNGGGEGPLVIESVRPNPNPNPAAFQILLGGPADRCHVQIYTSAMVRLADLEGGGRNAPGWLSVDARSLSLANGTYYYEVWAQRGERRSGKPVLGKLVVLR